MRHAVCGNYRKISEGGKENDMMKSLKNMLKQDKEKYTVPKSVHDYIPITAIWEDGIFKVGNKFAKTFRFTDINYLVAGKEDKETMFLCYSELLNISDTQLSYITNVEAGRGL